VGGSEGEFDGTGGGKCHCKKCMSAGVDILEEELDSWVSAAGRGRGRINCGCFLAVSAMRLYISRGMHAHRDVSSPA